MFCIYRGRGSGYILGYSVSCGWRCFFFFVFLVLLVFVGRYWLWKKGDCVFGVKRVVVVLGFDNIFFNAVGVFGWGRWVGVVVFRV